jgi:RNA polymerase sigma-70 factor (ECF subfamily)
MPLTVSAPPPRPACASTARGCGPQPSEATLVRAARGGDRLAFGLLHRAFAPLVHGIVLARAPASEADDLVQEVFLRVWRKLPSLREPDSFGPWIARIARRLAARRPRRRAAPLPPHLVDSRADTAAGETAEDARRVLDAIGRLPAAYRETLLLRLVEGMTGPEISGRTGRTPGSVRINLHRGLRLLRQHLDTTHASRLEIPP